MNRQEYNRKILTKLSELVEKHPYLRFGQILVNCGIIQYEKKSTDDFIFILDITPIDPYSEESELTWNRMCKNQFCFHNEK